jgi:hypothetical protein
MVGNLTFPKSRKEGGGNPFSEDVVTELPGAAGFEYGLLAQLYKGRPG